MTKKFSLGLVAFALVVAATSTRAATISILPPGSATTYAADGNSAVTHVGSPPQIATQIGNQFQGDATASADGFGVSATSFGYAEGQATEEYFFRVDGLQNGILVPLSLTSSLSAIAENAICATECQYASASSNISFDGKLVAQRSNNPNKSINFPPSESVLSGETQVVDLAATAETLDRNETLGAFAQANSSLTITIDPLWLLANPGYSLEFSDGIINAPISPAPLPPALPMFGAALLALGAFGWRKSRLAKFA